MATVLRQRGWDHPSLYCVELLSIQSKNRQTQLEMVKVKNRVVRMEWDALCLSLDRMHRTGGSGPRRRASDPPRAVWTRRNAARRRCYSDAGRLLGEDEDEVSTLVLATKETGTVLIEIPESDQVGLNDCRAPSRLERWPRGKRKRRPRRCYLRPRMGHFLTNAPEEASALNDAFAEARQAPATFSPSRPIASEAGTAGRHRRGRRLLLRRPSSAGGANAGAIRTEEPSAASGVGCAPPGSGPRPGRASPGAPGGPTEAAGRLSQSTDFNEDRNGTVRGTMRRAMFPASALNSKSMLAFCQGGKIIP